MTDPLTLDRFRDLADAYGGVMARWPIADHAAAQRLAATPEGSAILDAAMFLDERLDDWAVAAPSRALADRVTAGAGAGVGARTFRPRRRWWWSGIGIAATFAGAVAGAAVVAVTPPVDMVAGTTSFGDVAGMDN